MQIRKRGGGGERRRWGDALFWFEFSCLLGVFGVWMFESSCRCLVGTLIEVWHLAITRV